MSICCYLWIKIQHFLRMKRRFLYLFSLTLLAACGENTPELNKLSDNHVPMARRIQLALKSTYLKKLGFPESTKQDLQRFYASRNYQPLWSNDSLLTAAGEKFADLSNYPLALGIPLERWQKLKSDSNLVSKEILLTAKFGTLLHDLKHGFLDTAAKSLNPLLLAEDEDIELRKPELDTASDVGTWLAAQGSKTLNYQQLAKAVYREAYGKSYSSKTFKIPDVKKDSAGCYAVARQSLIDKGYLQKDAPDSSFLPALYRFQEDHGMKPDDVIGKYTAKALNESPRQEMERAVLSLERWRWREPFSSRYIWINIPEYMLRIYYNDTLFSEHNVVVGKFDTKTPQLSSRLRNIVSYPYWVVPFSITSKEFLPALKSNSGYLAKNHLRIFKSQEVEVDPTTVNWKKIRDKSFPYRCVQDPGKWNSLGIIKFEFSNSFGVYVHDTPQKHYFGKDIRSYSHGCIRCQNPDSLARFIIRRDEQKKFSADSLDSVLVREEHRSIPLRHPIDLKIDYITGIVNGEGKLVVLLDVYDRDLDYLKWYYAPAKS